MATERLLWLGLYLSTLDELHHVRVALFVPFVDRLPALSLSLTLEVTLRS